MDRDHHEYPSQSGVPTPSGKSNLQQSQLDTISSLVFAGHDTTANTLSWCLYELARQPELQRKLQAEMDRFIASLGRPLRYADLGSMPCLTRTIHETLRLWPIVHYGSMRELQQPTRVRGIGGVDVTVPEGTQVQLPPFALHHSTALWGPTALDFNPDRDFAGKELWGEDDAVAHLGGMGGWNPRSDRFMPFQSAPRQCIGLNFAQMEMRVLLFTLLRKFDFTLAPATAAAVGGRAGISIARPLLKPREGVWVCLSERVLPAPARPLLG